MQHVVVKKNAQITEIPEGSTIVGTDGSMNAWQITTLWSQGQLNAIGVYIVQAEDVPSGQVLVSYSFYSPDGIVVLYSPVYAPAPVTTITRRQLILQALDDNIISQNEALGLAQLGTIPAFMLLVLGNYSQLQMTQLQISLATRLNIDRSDPNIALMQQALGWTSQQMDNFFITAATL